MPSYTGSETNDASTNLFVGSVSAKTATENLSCPGGVVHEDQETVQSVIDDDSFRHNMNYVFAMGRCSQLCKTAGHDKVALASVVSLVDEATERLRRGLHITPVYTNVASISVQADHLPHNPVPAVPAHHTRPTSQKRFKSSLELARGRKRRAGNQVDRGYSVTENELTFMEPLSNTGKRHKTCSLCFQQGHTVRHCPSLEPYKGTPLPKDDR
jgi:hypothetical protein